jgi:SAM-dependent methyltransferase
MKMPVYSKEFFDGQSSDSVRSAELVVPLLIELIGPRSAIDVGCGVGGWLAVFQKNGVPDVLGVDGAWVDPGRLHIDPSRFRHINLSEPFRLDRRFDLVVSLEVAEHLPASTSSSFVESLVRLGPAVVFSAAVPHQGGTHHVNEQWPEYWVKLFERCGYELVDTLRSRIWNLPEVCFWYRQNMLLFLDRNDQSLSEVRSRLASSPASGMPLNLVHPEQLIAMHRYYEAVGLRHVCRSIPNATALTIKTIWRKLAKRSASNGKA